MSHSWQLSAFSVTRGAVTAAGTVTTSCYGPVVLQLDFEPQHEAAPENIEECAVGVGRSVESGKDRHARRNAIEHILHVQEHLPLVRARAASRVGKIQVRVERGS